MIPIDRKIIDYVRAHSVRQTEALAALDKETSTRPRANWMTDPEQTQFLQLLLETMGAKRVLEIGTFTGYTTLAMALTVPADGQVVTCDFDGDNPAIGRKYWQAAGVDKKISLRLGQAVDSMDTLLTEFGPGRFDFIYIDADKNNYDAYYERGLKLLRTGGLMGIDNVIWRGLVVDPNAKDADTLALRVLNDKIHKDQRVQVAMLTIGDGLTLVRKR